VNPAGDSGGLTEQVAAERLERFIRETFKVGERDSRFSRAVELFEGGYVDSVGMVELLGFVEEEFGVTLSDEDLLSDEFTTIDGMAGIISRRAAVSA